MRHLMPILATGAMILTAGTATADLGDQLFKLLPKDGAADDRFGDTVGISGTTAIVGAWRDDDNGSISGSAYLFDSSTGQQIAKLLPDDGAMGDEFGIAVAISGAIAIVGSEEDDDNDHASGSAYLFDITTGKQIAKILPDDGVINDRFGRRVAISDTRAIVGARGDANSGTAYLFDISDPINPVQIAKLLPDDGAAGDLFGWSVAISGTTAIVGAAQNDDNGEQSGSAYLFDATTGEQMAKLLPDDGAAGDQFGVSVAITDTTAIVGANGDDDNGSVSGSVYLFDVTTGLQIAKLLPDDGVAGDSFGGALAVSDLRGDDVAIIGAAGDDDNGTSSGSAYLFDISDPVNPLQIVKLNPDDGTTDEQFGRSVAISGTTAIGGVRRDDDNGTNSGSAYLFDANMSAFPADLTSCSITAGSTDNPPCIQGNLFDNDDVDQILRSQFGFSSFEPNLTEIVIGGNSPDAMRMFSIRTRDGSDTNLVVAKVKARNYVTNTIELITQYNVSFPNDDTPHSTLVESTDYVDANGDIEVRLRYVAPATFTPLGFTVGLDQVEVMVQ